MLLLDYTSTGIQYSSQQVLNSADQLCCSCAVWDALTTTEVVTPATNYIKQRQVNHSLMFPEP